MDRISFCSPPAINNYGRVAFQATVVGGSTGVWYEDNNTGALRRLAIKNDPAPHMGPTAQTFESFPPDIVYNNQGSVAFLATLTQIVGFPVIHALYVSGGLPDVEQPDPVLYVIAQEGEIIPTITPPYACQFLRVRPQGICRGSSMLSNQGSITFAAGNTPPNDVVIVARFPQL